MIPPYRTALLQDKATCKPRLVAFIPVLEALIQDTLVALKASSVACGGNSS